MNRMRVKQKPAFATENFGAEMVKTARSESSRATGSIQSVVVGDPKAVMQEIVQVLLESAIGARNHQCARALAVPGRWC
ncbi:hypothetical protein FJY63_08535 [Candidatus Sumerlaeota bacterium]|nr:hypothetical protein [Candidatus Sumerlaeota bacterium]